MTEHHVVRRAATEHGYIGLCSCGWHTRRHFRQDRNDDIAQHIETSRRSAP